MKVIVEARNTPNIWQLNRAPELRIYALNDFETDGGQTVLKGAVGTDEPHLPIPCTLDGDSVVIPSFEIDSTPLDRSALYTAIFMTRGRKTPYLSRFAIPPEPSNTTWALLKLFQQLGRMRFVNPPMAEIQMLVANMIANALTELRFSSETRVGNAGLSADPVDPIFPIAVGTNDPLWLSLLSGAGLLTDNGLGVMANGVATVPHNSVLSTSRIFAFSMSDGVTHELRARNIQEQVSFDIVSTDAGDEGTIAWILIN